MRRDVGSGLFALAAVGLFVLYRNRDTVREVLGRQGIRVPHRDELISQIRDNADRIRMNTNKLINRLQSRAEELRSASEEKLREVG